MKEHLNIIDVIEDSKLLGQFLSDQSTWGAWKTLLRAFYALPPVDGDLSLYQTATGREKWPQSASQEAWLAIGVRGGKSFITALLACYLSVFEEYQLSPGEIGYVLIVAPTKGQAKIIKRYLSSFFNENDFLRPFLKNETREEIELNNNICIAVISSDYRSLRGYTAIAAIVDEVAYLSIEGQRPDIEVIRALRGRLMSTGGPLIAISSPYAKRGTLYETHKRHYGVDGSPVFVWQAGSLTMNPSLSAEAIQAAHEEDAEAALADYDAQFRSDIETFVSRESAEACVVPGRYEIPFISGEHYFAFCDPSGGSKDSMTLAVCHKEKNVRILDLLRERKPPFSPDEVCKDFAKDLKRYGVHEVVGDRYGGEWPRERFQIHGITYKTSPKTKSDIYKELLPLVNSGEIELLDNSRLINQLVNLERRTGRSGRDSIDHGPGGHDDLCNAVAGGLVLMQEKKIAGPLF